MASMLSPSGLIGGRNLDLLVKAVMVGLEVAGHLLVVLHLLLQTPDHRIRLKTLIQFTVYVVLKILFLVISLSVRPI